jgi:hypothetical protein
MLAPFPSAVSSKGMATGKRTEGSVWYEVPPLPVITTLHTSSQHIKVASPYRDSVVACLIPLVEACKRGLLGLQRC